APNAQRNLLVLSLVLMLPGLNTGLAADDYLQAIILRGSHVLDGFDRPRLDIFRFCDSHLSPGFLRVGIFTWWDDPTTKLAFFRPVSALTHWLDYTLWPDSPWLMHLHCLVWGAVLLFAVRAIFRQLVPDRFVATLAFALYALDDARAWIVSWVASRNGVVASALSLWAFYLYCRGRAGTRAAAWLAPAVLAAGLLAGEGAVSVYAFIFAHALFLESGSLRTRLLRLWPYAVLLVAWRVGYRALGYGVSGSGLYVDPTTDPVTYAARWLERAPVLLFAQIGGPWSDAWSPMFVFPKLRAVLYAGAWTALACVVAQVAPLARRSEQAPLVRFGLLVAFLSTFPACTVFIADRLLPWVAVGACLVLAIWLAPILQAAAAGVTTNDSWLKRTIALALVSANLVMAPCLIPSRARGNVALSDVLDRSELGTPKDASIEDKLLVYVNAPAVPLAAYTPITRAALGIPRAKAQRILATSTTPMRIARVDERTLRLSPRGGFLQDPGSWLMWTPRRPFSSGEQIPVGETTYIVRAVTEDHRPLVVDARFDRPLEDRSILFRQWLGSHYEDFTPPALGREVLLPGADYMQVVFGVKLPVEARLDP
ncbi:MAG TPA: hypothetical protein VHM19_01830, partial [Polyangiales bacterium]|nr:hypothetical protein [Polyangiales bacterium]